VHRQILAIKEMVVEGDARDLVRQMGRNHDQIEGPCSREHVRESAEVRIEIFNLHRPVSRHEHLDAATNGPAQTDRVETGIEARLSRCCCPMRRP
jgi:hypothetical protein